MRYLAEYFTRFKGFIGGRVYLLLLFMFIAGTVEGFGVALFLPVMQDGFGDDKLSLALKFLFNAFNIEYSFTLMLVLIVIFCAVFRTAVLLLYARYFGRLSANLVIGLRRRVTNRIFGASYLYLLKKEIGYINNAIVREVACVVDAFVTFSNVLRFTLFGAIYVIMALLLNFKVAGCVLMFGIIITLFLKRLNALINQASVDLSASYGRFHSILIQALSKLKYLKSTLSTLKVSKIIDKENKALGNLRFKLFFLQSVSKNSIEPVVVLIVAALLFYYVEVMSHPLSEVIFLVLLFLQLSRQFMSAQMTYRKFLSARGSIEIFKNIERELTANTEELNENAAAPDFNKDIVFKDVDMVFPNGKIALDKANLRIRPRSVTAFVGFSGSGKSTIANIVTGLLRPTSGEVSFGEISYKNINLKILRENIGYVTQEDIVFNASIKDNISLWNPEIDKKNLEKVFGMAYISDFVNGLPDREEAQLGDNGLDISGGQRQRITIARELYKDTKLLILDEATSSLDSKAEKYIYASLKEFKGRKTMLVIAHRLSTIKNADYIYVLDEGRVVEEGEYDGLIRRKGEFKKMIEDQKLIETDSVKVSM